jgi:iron complex outermembrane receptor protein
MIQSRSASRLIQLLVPGLALALPAFAQTATSTAPANPDNQVVQMSSFEVTSTQGKGYVSSNAARGFKTDQSLLEIPQTDIVMTNDLLEDLSFNNTTDFLMFVGVQGVYEGETVAIRGNRVSAPWIDDMPDGRVYQDSVDVDSIEVIKGPAAVLYPNALLNGVVIKSTKKPLPYEQGIIGVKVDEWGVVRTTLDYNTPIGMLGDVKVIFRFVGSFQRGNSYYTNVRLNTQSLHPKMEFDYKSTTVRIFYDLDEILNHDEQEYGLLNPLTTHMYTAPLRPRTSVGMVPGNNTEYASNAFRIEVLQKYGQGWETRTQAMGYHLNRWGADVRPSGSYNFTSLTVPYSSFLDNEPADQWVVISDTQGKYKVGPIPMQSAFGFDVVDTTSENRISTLFVPGNAGFGTNDSLVLPFNNQQALNAVVVPSPFAYRPYPNYSRTKTLVENIYFQQQIEVIPGWVSLVGGFTWENLETINTANASLAASTTVGGPLAPLYPGVYTASDTTGSQFLHRFGILVHVVKDVVLYAMTSNTFSPNSAVDYFNNRLPVVKGLGSEVGMKTAFMDGRISSTLSFYHEALTNQATSGVGTNVQGAGYLIPIGSTTEQGFDGDITAELLPGWALIATFYKGTVTTGLTNSIKIGDTYDNSWSLFTRYDFKSSPLKDNRFWHGLGVGGGISRIGSYWQVSTGDISLPGYAVGAAPFAAIKQHEGSLVDCFADYRVSKHWELRLNIVNLLNLNFAESGQGAGDIDPAPPFTVSGEVEFRF